MILTRKESSFSMLITLLLKPNSSNMALLITGRTFEWPNAFSNSNILKFLDNIDFELIFCLSNLNSEKHDESIILSFSLSNAVRLYLFDIFLELSLIHFYYPYSMEIFEVNYSKQYSLFQLESQCLMNYFTHIYYSMKEIQNISIYFLNSIYLQELFL